MNINIEIHDDLMHVTGGKPLVPGSNRMMTIALQWLLQSLRLEQQEKFLSGIHNALQNHILVFLRTSNILVFQFMNDKQDGLILLVLIIIDG